MSIQIEGEVAYSPMVSVVLPIFNEEETLPILYQRLKSVFQSLDVTYELIFVDDGSLDRSFALLQELHEQDHSVRVVKFSRNFGHHLALTAGLDCACGRFIVMMDADLQDLPEEIPRLLAKLEEGFDVVVALRKEKQFSWHKRMLSHGFRWMMRFFLQTPLEGGVFRAFRACVLEQVKSCREVDRLVIGLVDWVGFRQTKIDVPHGKRLAGETKYSLKRQVELAWNALATLSTKPLRLPFWLGLWMLFVALGATGWVTFWGSFGGWQGLFVLVLWIGGGQFVCLGLLGDYLGRVFKQTRGRPLYIVEACLSVPQQEKAHCSKECP